MRTPLGFANDVTYSVLLIALLLVWSRRANIVSAASDAAAEMSAVFRCSASWVSACTRRFPLRSERVPARRFEIIFGPAWRPWLSLALAERRLWRAGARGRAAAEDADQLGAGASGDIGETTETVPGPARGLARAQRTDRPVGRLFAGVRRHCPLSLLPAALGVPRRPSRGAQSTSSSLFRSRERRVDRRTAPPQRAGVRHAPGGHRLGVAELHRTARLGATSLLRFAARDHRNRTEAAGGSGTATSPCWSRHSICWTRFGSNLVST